MGYAARANKGRKETCPAGWELAYGQRTFTSRDYKEFVRFMATNPDKLTLLLEAMRLGLVQPRLPREKSLASDDNLKW